MGTISPLPSIRLTSINIGKLVEEICDEGIATILVACCARSYFLQQLIEYTRPATATISDVSGHSPENDDPSILETDDGPISVLSRQSHLLQPTLKLIAASSQVKLAFCSTIPTLRAYLSALPTRTSCEDTQISRILIVNVLALHRDTSEFTLQGLSRSFSLIASLNYVFHGDLEMVECTDLEHEVGTSAVPRLWDVEVPLLSGSIKIGEAGQGWASRKVSVKDFANRWFDFKSTS